MKIPPYLVVVDRGQMKIFGVEEEVGQTAPAARLLHTHRVEEAHQRYAERFSDQAGAFPSAAASWQGNSTAERLSLENETEDRILRRLARVLDDHLDSGERWALAAPSAINAAFLKELSPERRRNLQQNVPNDLVNIPNDQLLEHFRVPQKA